MQTRVINFFGGPGAGKSTIKAGTFFELKCAGEAAAQIEEYATELSFEKDWDTLANQMAVTSEQDRRQRRLLNQVNWIVTDSPLVLACLYSCSNDKHGCFWEMFENYDNVNILVDRRQPYQVYGRHHSEEEAHVLDGKLLDLMDNKFDFIVPGVQDAPKMVVEFLRNKFGGFTGVA